MSNTIFVLSAAGLFLSAIYLALSSRLWASAGCSTVPGPSGLPFIGNAHQLTKSPNQLFMRWAKEYGEIYRVRLGWYDWYMLNTPEAVKEVLDRQSNVTSSRSPMPVLSDALSGGMRFLLMPYGKDWRQLRSVAHKLLTPKMSDTFQPSQEFEAKQLLYELLTDNKDEREFYLHIRRYTVSVIMTSTYGKRVPKWDCEEVREIYQLMSDFSEHAAPGKHLAEVFPPLARLPAFMQWWRKGLQPLQQRQARIWMKFWDELKAKLDTKQASPCFVRQILEEHLPKLGITELQAAFLGGSMIEAGSETTSSALNSCMLYLSAYPEVQAKAHAEISRVIGDERSPTFDDEGSLPYVRAIIKEILRLRPVTNMGTPHFTTSELRYKDYIIPKGVIVSIQQYPIHYDESRYPEPTAFRPERFLDHPHKSGYYAAIPDPYERDHFSFGAGRRICSGMHLAENSLFITLAKILWAFEMHPPPGQDGKPSPVNVSDDAYEPGVNTLPKRFSLEFRPRNKKVEQVLKDDWARAQSEGFTLRNVKVSADGMEVQA